MMFERPYGAFVKTTPMALFAIQIAKLARLTPFAPWRGVYRKPPKRLRRRAEFARSIICDRSSSVRKLQRLARRGEITLRDGYRS